MSNFNGQQKKLRTFDELAQMCSGRWNEILPAVAPAIAEALARAPFHVACPVHAGKTSKNFRMFEDWAITGGCVCNTCGPRRDGFSTIAFVNQYSRKEAVRDVAKYFDGIQLNPEYKPKVIPVQAVPKKDPVKSFNKMVQAIKDSKDIRGTPGQKYLEKRGIWASNISLTCRFHPGMEYYDAEEKRSYGQWPCILMPMRDINRKVVAVHRIFITSEGEKAPVPDVKKLMSVPDSMRGAAIKLHSVESLEGDVILGVGEGVETMLAVYAVTGMPVWSTFSTGLMYSLVVPKNVKRVVIWADKDVSKGGETAALALRDRLIADGFEVDVIFPDMEIEEGAKSVDWLDVLNKQGAKGFPARYLRRKAA